MVPIFTQEKIISPWFLLNLLFSSLVGEEPFSTPPRFFRTDLQGRHPPTRSCFIIRPLAFLPPEILFIFQLLQLLKIFSLTMESSPPESTFPKWPVRGPYLRHKNTPFPVHPLLLTTPFPPRLRGACYLFFLNRDSPGREHAFCPPDASLRRCLGLSYPFLSSTSPPPRPSLRSRPFTHVPLGILLLSCSAAIRICFSRSMSHFSREKPVQKNRHFSTSLSD